eukprot:sb/3464877/
MRSPAMKRCRVEPTPQLPSEVLVRVFSSLPYPDLVECITVCKKWRNVIEDNWFWHEYLKKRYGTTKKNETPKEDVRRLYKFQNSKSKTLIERGDEVVDLTFSSSGKYLVCCLKHQILVYNVHANFSLLTKWAPTGKDLGMTDEELDLFPTIPFTYTLINETDELIFIFSQGPTNTTSDRDWFWIYTFPDFVFVQDLGDTHGFDIDCHNWFGRNSLLIGHWGAESMHCTPALVSVLPSVSIVHLPLDFEWENSVVDNTIDGCKYGVFWEVEYGQNVATSDEVTVIPIYGTPSDPSHSCDRCNTRSGSSRFCLSDDYSTANVHEFRVDDTKAVSVHTGGVIRHVSTDIDNKIYVCQEKGGCVLYSEYNLSLDLIRDIEFVGVPLPLFRFHFDFWMTDDERVLISGAKKRRANEKEVDNFKIIQLCKHSLFETVT